MRMKKQNDTSGNFLKSDLKNDPRNQREKVKAAPQV
jgi:hypothetical protein